MRTLAAVGTALFLFALSQAPMAQVMGGTQQARPGMPARDTQQEEPTGTALIRGRIVAGDTGAPLRRAQVRLSSPVVRGGRVAQTDGEGRYEFRELPAGEYRLLASKAGYVDLAFGQRRPFEQGKQLALIDAQVADKIDIALPRGSAITGRILDEFGEPVADAMVQAMRYQFVGGQRQLMPTGRGGQSNDLGQYRIYGLPPGEYYVSATVRSGSMVIALEGSSVSLGGEGPTAYAPTYYPGTANPGEAARVPVAIGQEAGSVDLQLLPVRTARISGIVLNSSGQPAEGSMVMLMPRNLEAALMMLGSSRGRVAKDGTFTLTNVVPGDYMLQVRTTSGMMMTFSTGGGANVVVATQTAGGPERQGAQPEPEFANMPVTVAGQDVTGLALTTGPGGRMSGTVVFEDGPAPPHDRWQNMRVIARPVSNDMMATVGRGMEPVAEDGSFQVTGIAGDVLVRPAGLPTGWTLKAVEYNGQDVTDFPIEFRGSEEAAGVRVVLTSLSTEISGTVTDDRGQPVADYTAVVFAEDAAKWTPQTRFIAVGRPNQDGRFSVRDLPPGEYLAVALDYVQQGEWYDPSFLERIKSRATSFSLGAGETKSVELKISEY